MKRIFVCSAILILISASLSSAERIEAQVSYGRWSLSPFTTLLENESEKVVQEGFKQLVESLLLQDVYTAALSDVDFSSSGQFLNFSLWYNFKNSRFSLGLRGDYIDFSLPFSFQSEQVIDFWGLSLVEMDIQGGGEVQLKSATVSLLGRWAAISRPKLKLYLFSGLVLFSYQGDLSIEQTTRIHTPLGVISYKGTYDHTIDQLRGLSEDIPTTLLYPEVGLQFQYRFLAKAGLLVNASLSQGNYIAAGLFYLF